MVAWILAIGILVAGVVWYFYGGLESFGVTDPMTATGWDGVGSKGDGAESGQLHTGYKPPPRTSTAPPALPPPTTKVGYVPPSKGPASSTRSGRGHF